MIFTQNWRTFAATLDVGENYVLYECGFRIDNGDLHLITPSFTFWVLSLWL